MTYQYRIVKSSQETEPYNAWKHDTEHFNTEGSDPIQGEYTNDHRQLCCMDCGGEHYDEADICHAYSAYLPSKKANRAARLVALHGFDKAEEIFNISDSSVQLYRDRASN